MHFDAGTVQAYRLHSNTDNILLLKTFEKSLQDTVFTPAIHARINRMPIPIGFRQCPPLASVFRDIQNRIHQLEIAHAYISALARQIFRNLFILFFIEFHADNIALSQRKSIVLTESNWNGFLNLNKLPNASGFVYIADSIAMDSNEPVYMQQIFEITRAGYNGIHARHNRRANLSFADGHVSSMAKDEIFDLGFGGVWNESFQHEKP